ncbi:MAG: glutamate 5-kinase [Spirulina sp. DLM2.Bin59]|nr:MAG: glutamate 5-kinase [Spirulina sp. DLM2.Bin59]
MAQTLVIKIGTSSLTHPETGQLAIATLGALVETLTSLRQAGHRVVLVSSGAVGVGASRLKLTERPRTMPRKQAVAAVGQGRLMRVYDDLFTTLNQAIAQILLTRRDLVDRTAYVNAYNTFQALFELDVIPIVNENDTVAVEELRFGDNDTLSALVASLIEADWLYLLTDVDRLYSADPRQDPTAQPISHVSVAELANLEIEGGDRGSQWGTGGMVTKIAAARIASSAGVKTAILRGQQPQRIFKLLNGEAIGTQFEAQPRPDNARKRWIAHGLIPRGRLYLDGGAITALCHQGRSLLPAGIIKTEGEFQSSEAVILCDSGGAEVARGIVNYNSHEIGQIQGHHSDAITKILGYSGAETIIHRDNLVLTLQAPDPPLKG